MVDSASADRQLIPRRLLEAYAAFTRVCCADAVQSRVPRNLLHCLPTVA